MTSSALTRICALPAAALVALAFAAPYTAALALGLGNGLNSHTLSSITPVLAFTLSQAAWSTLLALALGLPGAWLLSSGAAANAGKPTPLRARLVRALTAVPFAMPPILVVLGFVLFWGNAGWANRALSSLLDALSLPHNEPVLRVLYRPRAVVLAHAFYNFPLVIRLTTTPFARLRRAYSAPAALLGASPAAAFFTVILPLALPSVLAAALLVFLYCFTSFAVVLVLGGGPQATTIAVEIYRYARISLDYSSAGTLSLLETFISAVTFALYISCGAWSRRLLAGAGSLEIADRPLAPPPAKAARRLLAALYGALISLLILGPLLSVPLESFLSRATRASRPLLSLRWWLTLTDNILPCLLRSTVLAALSATLACLLALSAARAAAESGEARAPLRALLRLVCAAPLASSGIVLGLGWITLYGRHHGLAALTAVHALAALPFAFNTLHEGLAALPANTLAAASTLGASPLRRLLTVEIPLVAERIQSAWGFACAISLGELSAPLMLGVENWETLPLYIYHAAGAYRYGSACAAGTLLLLTTLLALSAGARQPPQA